MQDGPVWASSGSCDQICNCSIPLFISGTVEGRLFKFYAALTMEEYNRIYTEDGP